MPFITTYPDDADPIDVYLEYPEIYEPWKKVQNAVMRGPSAFTPAERELIAAYTSGLNACQYCYGGHVFMSEALGVAPGLVEGLLDDLATAEVPAKLKPVLAYVRKLTLEPSKLIQEDADAVFEAGWDGRALHDLVAVCAMFNFMNRLVDGLGIQPAPFESQEENSAEAIRSLDYIEIVEQTIKTRGKRPLA